MNNKDVIYIDVEDEITNIIDKVNSSKSKVVALVLPKRATVFQSVVNMKLLKKKSTEVKKNVILVTSEAGLMPLAGAVGVHVAKSLQAKPEIPPNPNVEEGDEGPVNLEDEAEKEPDENAPLDKKKSIGELAGLAAVGAVAAKNNEPENIDFDNDAATDPMGLDAIDKESKGDKPKRAKKAKGLNGKGTKIPDFNKFRKKLLIGGAALVALIVLWFIGFVVLPKATIIVQTNTSTTNSTIDLTLSQSAGGLDPSNNTVPAKYQTMSKTSTSTSVNTTGSKNIGTSATGPITITNPCDITNGSTSSVQVPSGTQFTDSRGNSYTSNNSATVPGFSSGGGGHCRPGVANISVTAVGVGSGYNNSSNSTTYTSNNPSIATFDISGGPMSGGSSQQVQVVAQADINSAQSQLATPNSSQIEQQLEATLKSEGYQAIPATYVSGSPTYTPSAAVGVQANSVTVTETATYSMYGARQSDLNTLILNNVNQQINPANQSVLNSGVSSATFTQQSSGSATDQVTMQTGSTIGPKINAATIAKQSVGVKSGDIKSTILQTPGVTNVIVKYSPFWVSSTPHNIKKITVIIEKANGSQP